MKNQRTTRLALLAAIAAAACAAAPTIPAFAQARGGAQAAAKGAAGAKQGIDALDDNKLMGELANRGLDGLLDFYFQKTNVPEDKRKEIVVLVALRNLDTPDFARKSLAERKVEIQKIVDGINAILPTINDPERLLRYASSLITNGTLRLVNTLEYWGDNPKTQATLNPIAETVDKILAQANTLSKADSDKWVNQIKQDDDPAFKKWMTAENLFRLGTFTRANAAYGLALSYDKAAVDKRTQVCKDAIVSLHDFEENPAVAVQAQLITAKLAMVMGGDEGYKLAKDYFKKVIDAQGKDVVGQQYQARYFSLVADVLAHKPDEAAKGLPDLKQWQETNLPKDAATQKGADAAYSMLEYRVLASKADAAADAATKEKVNADAVAVLMDLVAKRPDLRSVIFEQVMGKIPDKPKLAELNPLLLEALVTRGIDALQHKTPEKEDSKNIQMAADAAREIVRRKGQPGIAAEQVDMSAYSIGIFEEKIGTAPDLNPDERRTNQADAAEAFVAYVKNFGANPVRVENSLDHALPLLVQLRKDDANNDRVNKIYDEALDVSLFKANRTSLAYVYGLRRIELQDYANARKGFALVKSDNPQVEIMRRYYQMVCDNELSNKADQPAQKKMYADEIQKLNGEVTPLLDAQITALKSEPAKQVLYLRTKVKMDLIAADVARANKQPDTVLSVLTGFEDRIKALPAEERNQLLGQALFLRVNALMATNKTQQAIAEVQKLVTTQTPEQALVTVSTLLEKLNTSFNQEKNKDNPDPAVLQLLAAQRATLANLLVDQVQKNPKMPEGNKRQYLTFNATAQRQAAELETDPAKKKGYIASAVKQYQELDKGVPPDSSDHASFQRLIALAQFQLGDAANVKSCHDTLNALFADGKFGSAMIRANADADAKPNEIYWEGLLTLLRCKVILAKVNNDETMLEDARRIMKTQVVIPFGDQAGGDAFAKDFRALRKELLGDWKPTDVPATQPVAGGQQ